MEANTENAAEVIAKNRQANEGENSGCVEKNDGSPRPKASESRQRGDRKGRSRRDRGRGRKPASEADTKNRSGEQPPGREKIEASKAVPSETGAAPPVKAEGKTEGQAKRKRRRRRRSDGGARKKNPDDKGTQN
jgi:hypothetical protein